MEGCVIGDNNIIKNSLIMENMIIGNNNDI